jgi:hypothetical protein
MISSLEPSPGARSTSGCTRQTGKSRHRLSYLEAAVPKLSFVMDYPVKHFCALMFRPEQNDIINEELTIGLAACWKQAGQP